nr:hypothetical protein [Tanacetum cinerariifolium]
MTAILKQFQATPPPASVKAVEEICVTCGGAHPYYQRLATGSGHLPSNTIANPKGELKSITTRSGIVLDGPFVPIPFPFNNPEEDERVEETLTDQDLAEYTIKVPPPLVQKSKPPSQRNFVVHLRDPLYLNIPYPLSMLKQKQQEKMKSKSTNFALLSNKEKLLELANTPLNENCLAVILKKLPKKLGDLGKFLISCGFSELKCKALADLANRAICTPAGIVRDVSVPVSKFTFPANFLIIDYESDHRVPLILGRPFLRTARALIDVHGEEMILRDEPRVHVPNVLTTHPTLMLDSDFIPFDNSILESEIFYFDIEEKNSGSTTIHADISLLDLECFNFKPDPGELTGIVDSGIRENVPSTTNVNLPPEKDHSPLLAYVVWIFLSFLTYPVVPPNLLSFRNEDTIFGPDIANYHFHSLLPDVSHRCETFMKFNVYPKLLNESPMEILSSSCSPMNQ